MLGRNGFIPYDVWKHILFAYADLDVIDYDCLGEFRREDGCPIVVTTKFSPAKFFDPSTRFSPNDIISTLDDSLERLGMSEVDLYQLHYPVARHKLNRYLDAMVETVKSVKAKAVGGDPYPSAMRTIALVTQLDIFKEGEPSPLMRRLFAKPYMMQREKLEPLFELMHGISKKYNATISQVALNWLLASNPRVIPIPGEKNSRQAAANAATLNWKLTREEFNKLSQTERAIWTSLPR